MVNGRFIMLNKKLVACFIGLLFVGACSRYSSKPFKTIESRSAVEKNNIRLNAKKLSAQDSEYYFSCDLTKANKQLWIREIFPAYKIIHLSIYNDSANTQILDAEYLNLSLIETYRITDKIEYNVNFWIGADNFHSALVASTQRQNVRDTLRSKFLQSDSVVQIAPHTKYNVFLPFSIDASTSDLSLVLINQTTGEKTVFDIVL